MSDSALAQKAKIVYEYDVADVDAAYLHAAVAHTFRSHGIQWATQFHYCSYALARENIPYPTHNLNLVTSPSKAIRFLIASEAFHRLNRNCATVNYDDGGAFGPFTVSHDQDLSLMSTDTEFLYSNPTHAKPRSPSTLTRIAGYGDSPVVQYTGTGAFFLDRLSPGKWRLEIFPDVTKIEDPYGRARQDREIVDLYSRSQTMHLLPPDLGDGFVVHGHEPVKAYGGRFAVTPGTYILTKSSVLVSKAEWADSIVPTVESPFGTRISVKATGRATSGQAIPILATVSTRSLHCCVRLQYRIGTQAKIRTLPMSKFAGDQYAAEIPGNEVLPGQIQFAVLVTGPRESILFPSPNPFDHSEPVVDTINHLGHGALKVGKSITGNMGSTVNIDSDQADPRQQVQIPLSGFSENAHGVTVRARARDLTTSSMTVQLVDKDGIGVRFDVPLTQDWGEQNISWDQMLPAEGWILLRKPSLAAIRIANVSFGQSSQASATGPYAVEIGSISSLATPKAFKITVLSPNQPFTAFDPNADSRRLVVGMPPRTEGFAGLIPAEKHGFDYGIVVRKFGWPRRLSVRIMLTDRPAATQNLNTLVLKIRSLDCPQALVTVSVLDRDGRAWSAIVTGTLASQTLRIPLAKFKPAEIFRCPFPYPALVSERVPRAFGHAGALKASEIDSIQVGLVDKHSTTTQPLGCAISKLTLDRL